MGGLILLNAMVLEKSLVPKAILTQFLERNNFTVTILQCDYSSMQDEIQENIQDDTSLLFLDYDIDGDIWQAIRDLGELKNKNNLKIVVSCSDEDKVEILPHTTGEYDVFCPKPFTDEKLAKILSNTDSYLVKDLGATNEKSN